MSLPANYFRKRFYLSGSGSGSTQRGPWIVPSDIIITRIDFSTIFSPTFGVGLAAWRQSITVGLASVIDIDDATSILAEMRGTVDNNGTAGTMALSTFWNKPITGIQIPVTKNAPLYMQCDYSLASTFSASCIMDCYHA